MDSDHHQQAKWPRNSHRSPLPQDQQPHISHSSKPPYDHMQAWQHLPKETQNALPKSCCQVASMKSLNIRSAPTDDSHKEQHAGVFSSLIRAIDAELKEWQTTTTTIPSIESTLFDHSPQQPHGQSPHDSAIDLNDFAWASTPKTASSESGPRRALRMLEGRDGEDSPTVPPLFSNVPRTNSFNDHDDSSFHVTRSNVYRAAGWRRESVDTISFLGPKPVLIAETSEEGKGTNASTGNETTCVGVMGERTAAEDGNTGSVRRAITKLRRVSKFGGV